MWTSTLELSSRRVILTQILGSFWRGAYFSSFAPLQVQNLPRQPLPAPNWVRVRNHLAGVCGSDLHQIYVDGDFRIAPAALPSHRHSYPGHEVVGEIIEVGDDVQHLHVGDRVVLQSGPNCISSGVQPLCRSCASGNYNLCERGNLLPGPERVGGGWSEEMLLHEQQLFRISPEMSDEQAVLLEPTAVAVRAVLRRLPHPGDHVLIIGAGTIGLLTLQVIRAFVPEATVSVMARHPFQIEQATRMGAAHILYPQDSYKSVERTTGGQLYTGMFGNKMLLGGYEVIYDTVGSKRTIHDSLRWARAGGTVVVVGISLHTMHLDLSPIWYQEIDLAGTLGHGLEIWPIGTHGRRSTFAIAAEMIEHGQLYPEKLITHRFALNNFREALTTATEKSRSMAMKVVFDYALLPASVVPNVRATARQRRPITTTAEWPQEQQSNHMESFWTTTPGEHPVPPTPTGAPAPEPVEIPTPEPHSAIAEDEQLPGLASEEQPEPVEIPAPELHSAIAEIEQLPELSGEEQPEPAEMPTPDPQNAIAEDEQLPGLAGEVQLTPENERRTITATVSKPRRARQSARLQKTTENVPIAADAIDHPAGTNQSSDALEQ